MKVTGPVVAIPVTGSRGAVIGGTREDERTGHGDPGGTGPTSQNVTCAPASGPVVPLSVAVSLVTNGEPTTGADVVTVAAVVMVGAVLPTTTCSAGSGHSDSAVGSLLASPEYWAIQ